MAIVNYSLVLFSILSLDSILATSLEYEKFFNKTKPEFYNKSIAPKQRPIKVNVSIFIFGVGNIYDSRSEFNFDLLLRTSWLDKRIASTSDENVTVLQGGIRYLNRLWTPSLHIINGHEPSLLQDFNQHPVLVRIHSNGLILMSKRIKLAGVIQMDFSLYPFDMQQIKFEIESNEMAINDMKLYWAENKSCSFSKDFIMNGFKMIEYKLIQTYTDYPYTGSFSRVEAKFFLRRKFHQIFLDVYIPFSLLVIVSWSSFWIEITAAPARISLGVTVLLTMVTIARTAREKLPPVSYIYALDVWMLICIIFVFASIIEYVAVNYIYYTNKRLEAQIMKYVKKISLDTDHSSPSKYHQLSQRNHNNNNRRTKRAEIYNRLQIFEHQDVCPSLVDLKNTNRNNLQNGNIPIELNYEDKAYKVDRYSRIIFPLFFILFNITFWTILYILSMQIELELE